MLIMRDADQQYNLEEQRELEPPIPEIELDENSSNEDKMKARLSELLHKNPENEEDNNDLLILMMLLEDDDDPDDDIFKGKHGNYSIGDGFVGGDIFKDGTANDAPENIDGVLEMAAIAKANFGDDTVFLNGNGDPEQMAMHTYAAELNGLNVGNSEEVQELSPEIKQKMDAAWAGMQNGGQQPELGNELTLNDPDTTVDQTLALGM